MGLKLLILSVFLLWINHTYAVPAPGIKEVHTQPDGSQVILKKWGDEWLSGYETLQGYTVVKDSNGYWVYATLSLDGELIPTSVRADSPPPVWLTRGIRPVSDITIQRVTALRIQASQKVVPSTGTGMLPVVLMNFSDTTTTYTVQDFDNLIFGTNVYSLKDYYEEVSYGNFTVSGVVVGWYTSQQVHDYYGQNVSGFDAKPGTLVYEAAVAADPTVDFSLYDTDGDCKVDVIAVVHQGLGEETSPDPNDIWSHRWSLSSAFSAGRSDFGPYVTNDTCASDPTQNVIVDDYIIMPEQFDSTTMATVGVFVHEFGHSLGIPDLYDTDRSSYGAGDWEVMASGSWNGVNTPGDRPAHFSAHSKAVLGWVNPAQVTSDTTVTLTPVINSPTSVIQILNGTPGLSGEYFLLENRIKAGFDAALPSEGLLIWHIDESKFTGGNTVNTQECPTNHSSTQCTSNHYGLALEQADGAYDLENKTNQGDAGDPFPGSSNNTSFTFNSTPTNSLYGGTDPGFSITNISWVGQDIVFDIVFNNAVVNVPDINVQPNPFNYGNVLVGDTVRQVFTISNNGTADLTVSSVTVAGTDASMFAVSLSGGSSPCGALPVVLPPGSQCTVEVSLTPSRSGTISAQLEVVSDDPDTPTFTVNLTATGVTPVPDIDVQPNPYDYGTVLVGNTVSQVFTISNNGTGDLTVSSVTVGGADASMFSVSLTGGSSPCGALPVVIQPGGSCTVEVSLTPSRSGTISAQLEVVSDDPDTPTFTVNLTATGVDSGGDGDGNGCPNQSREQALIMLLPVSLLTLRRIKKAMNKYL